MTKDERIYKHYQAIRHRGKHGPLGCFELSDDKYIRYLADHWKMPCKDIKRIVRGFQAYNKARP